MPRYVTVVFPPDAYGPRSARQGVRARALIPDPIAELEPLLDAQLVARVSAAERALVTLNATARGSGFGSLTTRLLHAESVGSSWIEGVRISPRRLARAEAEMPATRDTTAKAVLANVAAVEALVAVAAEGRPLALDDLLAAHKALMPEPIGGRGSGAFRQEQNWIGGSGLTAADARFVPPPPDLVPGLVTDVLRFLERRDVAPVVQAAVAHAQFEAIHPFVDGNGRIGRALIHYAFRRSGVASEWVPPISPVLAAHQDAYISSLNAFAAGEVTPWLGLFSAATEVAAARSMRLLEEVGVLQETWRKRAGKPRRDSAAEALIVALPGHPVVTVEMAAALTGRSSQAANAALAALEEAGIVRSTGKWRRVFEAGQALALVETFERDLTRAKLGTQSERGPSRRRGPGPGPER